MESSFDQIQREEDYRSGETECLLKDFSLQRFALLVIG